MAAGTAGTAAAAAAGAAAAAAAVVTAAFAFSCVRHVLAVQLERCAWS